MPTIDADRFGVALDAMLDEYEARVTATLKPSVRKAVAKGRKDVMARAGARADISPGKTKSAYVAGFSTRTSGEGREVHGEIGNKSMPGLVHLLENGHAKMGGGRVAARPHVEGARDTAEAELRRQLRKSIGEVA